MENIFAIAKFGDKFRTRDGRMAIFCGKMHGIGLYRLVIEGHLDSNNFNEFGKFNPHGDNPRDIVSRWQPEINEKELDDMATYNNPYPNTMREGDNWEAYMKGFKAGYKAAIKQQ